VGATTVNVMGEFLLDATFIGVVGGLRGYGLGVGVVVTRNVFFPAADGSTLFLITPTLTVFTIGFATVLGAAAGVLPACRAARLDPVLAFRYEQVANVRLVDLTKHYKRGSEVIKALDGVTHDIDNGACVAVVGR